VWDGHLESRKNPDRLKRSIHVDSIGVHSTFVYIHAVLRVLIIWANCLFSFNMSFLLRKVEDMTTISKSQSPTAVSIRYCTLRVPNETTTLFLLRVIIKAIFIHACVTACAHVRVVARVRLKVGVMLCFAFVLFHSVSLWVFAFLFCMYT